MDLSAPLIGTISSSTTLVVADAALAATGATLSGSEGGSLSGTVASFTDGKSGDPASTYTATINWGDGSSTSTGTVAVDPSGGFTVTSPTHTYAEDGTYTIHTMLSDAGSASSIATSTATVADAALAATGVSPFVQAGIPFSGPVATFTDAKTGENVSNYTATIDWGDGSPLDTGTVTGVTTNPNGGYTVEGSHTYASAGSYTLTVTPKDAGGATAVATSAANFGHPTVTYLARISATRTMHGVAVRWAGVRHAVAGYRLQRAGRQGVMHTITRRLLHRTTYVDRAGRGGDFYRIEAIGRTGRVLASAVIRAH